MDNDKAARNKPSQRNMNPSMVSIGVGTTRSWLPLKIHLNMRRMN
jgi:hypothetical protein